MTINMNVVSLQEKSAGNVGLKSLGQENVIVSREHEDYKQRCDNLEEELKETIKSQKLLKQEEMKRIGNKKASEVTFVEKEWYHTMQREGGMSTRMY